MIDSFSQSRFESALPVHKLTGAKLWVYGGFKGEHWYLLSVGPGVSIQIWSSIDSTGMSSGTGLNSIRCYLVNDQGAPVSNKLKSYVTRVAGWEGRLRDQLTRLYRMGRMIITPCEICRSPRKIYLVKKGAGKGGLFTKCGNGHKVDIRIDLDKAPVLSPAQAPSSVPLTSSARTQSAQSSSHGCTTQ